MKKGEDAEKRNLQRSISYQDRILNVWNFDIKIFFIIFFPQSPEGEEKKKSKSQKRNSRKKKIRKERSKTKLDDSGEGDWVGKAHFTSSSDTQSNDV